jgi:hypothetical protein
MEAEQSVLGAILVSPEKFSEVSDFLAPTDFYREVHARIYQTMIDLVEEGTPVDIVTVSGRLRDRGQLEGCGGSGFLAGLSQEVGFATNAVFYAQRVHDKSTLRRLIEVGQGLCQECFNGKAGDIKKIIEVCRNKIAEIEGGARIKGLKNIAKQVREHCEATDGDVKTTDVYKSMGLATKSGVGDILQKKAVNKAMERLVKEGVLSRIKKGLYRFAEAEAIPIDISVTTPDDEVAMRYPFGLERWFVTYLKTIVLISGEPDAGKTAMLLNIAHDNMHLSPIYYWSSEMGAPELRSRLENFDDFDAKLWVEKVKFAERGEKFEDVVRLYPDAIHIIDNLEMHDDFFLVGREIDAIWRALGKGVVVIGLHKEKGKQYALGGMQMAKRPKLWLNLEPRKGGGNLMTVAKAKNWRDKLTNIKNMTFDYHLVKGCKIIEME